ncbi:hypothetical protein N431DRAFT_512770 [Stipitochalara longipes BDJ]|nr:hypothetical protein N431DRAFT_512770 [Stipitochalara longipes BDJ]
MNGNANKLPASPITFNARGLVPDLRLNMLGKMMHVHSTVLKMHSYFFFSYLDASGGDWQLVSNNDKAGDLALSTFKGEQEQNTRAFYNLLRAMYSLPYTLESATELITMSVMARFYASLPILSRSLSASILQSKGFLYDMESNSMKLVIVAKELRHAELFKDCLLLYLGPWHSRFSPRFNDPQLNVLASTIHNKICSKLAVAQEELVDAMAGRYDHVNGNACLPCFFRALKNTDLGESNFLKETCLDPLLENCLILPVLGQNACHFLCVKILDDELPWDRTQTDW